MATIKFKIRSKANKNVSIKIRLTNGKETELETSTGFFINPKDWSETSNLPKQTTPENKNLSSDLKKLDTFICKQLNSDLGKGITIDLYWLQSQINSCFKRTPKLDTGLVVNHLQYIIDNANTRKVQGRNKLGLSESRVKSYQTFKKLITEYQSEIRKQIHLLDINKAFVDRFTNWLINTRSYSTNYAGKQIDNLKTVCLDAEKLDIPINSYVKQIQGFSEANDDRYIVTLSFDEIEHIRNVELKSVALDNARKWMLIGCEIGQRGNDMLNITKEDIRYKNGNYYIDIVQQKTGKSVTVGIISPYIVDIIENSFPYKISIQLLNEYIKEVCKLAGLTEMIEGKKLDAKTKRKVLGFYPKYELVTSHSFRRSFSTNYYKKIPTAVLIGITGHSKESLFLQYINQREDKDSNADLFRQFYEQLNKDTIPQLKVVI